MNPKFNVGDKVLYKSNTGQEHVCTIDTVKQMYMISNDDIFATVDKSYLSIYVPDLSEATVDDLVQEIHKRGFDGVELKRSSPRDMMR
jgi:hypothetical protein